ncbi:hypothetical protein [Streptomyces buecherae]|uniref:zinc ribbon domain-containing protein n=1 Tax=Streptomyces buecherae TaxID=2763006 RepID=UPI0036B8B644
MPPVPSKSCSACGASAPNEARFCMGCGGDLLAPGPDVPQDPVDEPPTVASTAVLTSAPDDGPSTGEPASGPDPEVVPPDAPTRSHTARDIPYVDPPTVPGRPLPATHPATTPPPARPAARPPVHPPTLPAGPATPPPGSSGSSGHAGSSGYGTPPRPGPYPDPQPPAPQPSPYAGPSHPAPYAAAPPPGYATPPPRQHDTPPTTPVVVAGGVGAAGGAGTARRASGRRRVMVWLAVGVAAFVVGGGATAGVLVLRDDGGDDRAPVAVESESPGGSDPDGGADVPGDGGRESPSARASAPATTSAPPTDPSSTTPTDAPTDAPSADASPDASGDLGPGEPPEGYRMARDPQGFSLAVPTGWAREMRGGQIDYRGPGATEDNSYLRIGVLRGTSQSAIDHFRELEGITSARTGDYEQLDLSANTFQGRDGARWEFRWVEKKTGRSMHAIDQAYVTEDGTEYAIYFQGPAETFAVDREAFDAALDTWSEGG